MATSEQVAERAGVSRATVSNVVNGTRYVSPELRERVLAAIEELNYRPDGIARSLAARRTCSVGVIAARISTSVFPEIMSSVEQVLGRAGYSPVLADSRESEGMELENLRLLTERRVDGILWIPCTEKNVHFARDVMADGTPVVVMDRRLSEGAFDTVVSDNVGAGRLATKHLLDTGHRSIAIVTFSQIQAPARERLKGYESALCEAGIEPDQEHVCKVSYPEYEDAVEQLAGVIQERNPDAVIACSDTLTLATLAALRKLGLRVARDISVIGFDHSEWSAFVDPPLTVIMQDTEGMGRIAARLLVNRMATRTRASGEAREPQLFELPVSLLKRGSCNERTEAGRVDTYGDVT